MTGKGHEASYWNSIGVWLASCIYIDPLKALVNEITPLIILSPSHSYPLTRGDTSGDAETPPLH